MRTSIAYVKRVTGGLSHLLFQELCARKRTDSRHRLPHTGPDPLLLPSSPPLPTFPRSAYSISLLHALRVCFSVVLRFHFSRFWRWGCVASLL